ncbi:MAG: hypothetical protein A9183_06865 [Dehalococcoides mccartyi]|nr:MAG: hypothetical protein A9183_06865 [Dehalococcoides mccartyi]
MCQIFRVYPRGYRFKKSFQFNFYLINFQGQVFSIPVIFLRVFHFLSGYGLKPCPNSFLGKDMLLEVIQYKLFHGLFFNISARGYLCPQLTLGTAYIVIAFRICITGI